MGDHAGAGVQVSSDLARAGLSLRLVGQKERTQRQLGHDAARQGDQALEIPGGEGC